MPLIDYVTIKRYSLYARECRGQAIGMPSISSIHPIRPAKKEKGEGRVGDFKEGWKKILQTYFQKPKKRMQFKQPITMSGAGEFHTTET